jgi:carbon monoxide dehydrogenase subunit G
MRTSGIVNSSNGTGGGAPYPEARIRADVKDKPMATVEKSAVITASAEQIFSFISEPMNLPEVWPSLFAVRDITPSATGGLDFKWTYKMAGLRLDGASRSVEYTPPNCLAVTTSGGIKSTTTWRLEPQGDATRVTIHAELTVPGKLFGKLAEPLVMRENAKEAETILANVKKRLERP